MGTHLHKYSHTLSCPGVCTPVDVVISLSLSLTHTHTHTQTQIFACKEKQTSYGYQGEQTWGQKAIQSKAQRCIPSEGRKPSGMEKYIVP